MWYPLQIFLTKAQYTWLKAQSVAKRKSMPDLVQDIIDSHRLSNFNKQLIELENYKQLLMRDSLTNLYSRYYYDEVIKAIEKSKMYPVSVIVADIDGLKKVNDTLGHCHGDELIKRAAEVLKKVFRDNDIVARIGGDEFAVLLPFTTKKIAEKRCVNLCKLVKEHDFSMSVGYATSECGDISIKDLIDEADKMMYRIKKVGCCHEN